MRRIFKAAMVNGMLGGQGASGPTEFADAFGRADGAVGNGWQGDTWYIEGGVLKNNPTLLTELLNNPSFETYTGTIDDATSDTFAGWTITKAGSEFVGAVSDAQSGSVAARMANGGGSRPVLSQVPSKAVGKWYKASVYAKGDGATTAQLWFTGADELNLNTQSVTYTQLKLAHRITVNNGGYTLYHQQNQAGDVWFDNASYKEISHDTMFNVRDVGFVPASIRSSVVRSQTLPIGIAHYADANNYVLAYLNYPNEVILLKRVGGANPVEVSIGTYVYSAGSTLELIYDKDAQTYAVKYNDSTRITAQSVTDAVFATATKIAAFSTDNAGSHDNVYALKDFT